MVKWPLMQFLQGYELWDVSSMNFFSQLRRKIFIDVGDESTVISMIPTWYVISAFSATLKGNQANFVGGFELFQWRSLSPTFRPLMDLRTRNAISSILSTPQSYNLTGYKWRWRWQMVHNGSNNGHWFSKFSSDEIRCKTGYPAFSWKRSARQDLWMKINCSWISCFKPFVILDTFWSCFWWGSLGFHSSLQPLWDL